jgi:hypothetical protein
MPAMILCLFRFVRLLCSGHHSIVIENAALRLQLRAFQRARRRPVLTASDRLFWCALAKLWSGWRGALMFVQPETVVRWQRERFRRFWARLSKPKGIKRGRPCIPADPRRLIVQMATENPLWRAPRMPALTGGPVPEIGWHPRNDLELDAPRPQRPGPNRPDRYPVSDRQQKGLCAMRYIGSRGQPDWCISGEAQRRERP